MVVRCWEFRPDLAEVAIVMETGGVGWILAWGGDAEGAESLMLGVLERQYPRYIDAPRSEIPVERDERGIVRLPSGWQVQIGDLAEPGVFVNYMGQEATHGHGPGRIKDAEEKGEMSLR